MLENFMNAIDSTLENKPSSFVMSFLKTSSWLMKKFFASIITLIEKPAVRLVEAFKHIFHWHTYQVEYSFVAIILGATVLLTGNGLNYWKWIEAAAVMLTFMHLKISQRLAEHHDRQIKTVPAPRLNYHWKLEPIFMAKEILWMITLVHLQAWAALVGTFLFLMYYPWREVWRKYHPLQS